jgi:hypothetical protein
MSRAVRFSLVTATAALLLTAGSARLTARQNPASKSAALAKELVDLLSKQQMTSIAARDPIERDRFIAALFYPGQLMVVSGKYTVPVLLDEKISFDKYMDVYVELNGAAQLDSKIFIEDQFADGLFTKEDTPFDSWVVGDKATTYFDGDHRKAKMSKDEYRKLVADADQQYSKLLELLIAQAKASVKGV